MYKLSRFLRSTGLLIAAGLSLLSPATAQDGAAKRGGDFVYYDYLAISSFQLQNALLYQNSGVINQIVDRLVYRDPKTGEFFPWLATSWEVNDQKTVFTFTIRDGVTFSDGSALDAETVKVNLDVLAFGDKDKGVPRHAIFPDYDRTEVVDTNTVRVFLNKTDAGFIDTLSEYRAGIVSRATYSLSLEDQSKPESLT